MICSREEIRRALAEQYHGQRGYQIEAASRPHPTAWSRSFSPALATAFLALIIVSATAGIVAILNALR
jgi:hypothetical protein